MAWRCLVCGFEIKNKTSFEWLIVDTTPAGVPPLSVGREGGFHCLSLPIMVSCQCSGPTYVKVSSSLFYAIKVKLVRSGSMHLTFRVKLSRLPASIPEDPDVVLLAGLFDELLSLLLELLVLVESLLELLELVDDEVPVEELLVVL